jgi:SWI/SNF-related matrix-associated actin-dependent regulator of chromatin subfamily A-like protein 1
VTRHLDDLDPCRPTCGRLCWVNGWWSISGLQPAAEQWIRRVMPWCRKGEYLVLDTPREVETLHWLQMRYPLEVEPGSRAAYARSLARARKVAARRERTEPLAPATDIPRFAAQLYPYQALDVSRMLDVERTLLAWEMGLGKTFAALAAAAAADAWPLVLVVPAQIRRQWMSVIRELMRFEAADGMLPFGDDAPVDLSVMDLRGQTPDRLPVRRIYMLHYGLLQYWQLELERAQPQMVIFDEAQELRRSGSNKYMAAKRLASVSRYCFGLSGTPIYNYGAEIWNVLDVIDRGCLGAQERFTDQWCAPWGSGGDRRLVREPARLNEHLVGEGLMIRRRKSDADVACDLPVKRRAVIELDHDEHMYRELMREAVELAKQYDDLEWTERGRATREVDRRSRMAAGIAKAPAVAAWVVSLLEAGERPIIFAHHHAVHERLLGELDRYGVASWTGRQTEEKKAEAFRRFQAGEAQAILIALRSSTGIDGLQQHATCVVFAELDWSPKVHEQCEDRLHRAGAHDGLREVGVMCYYLVADTSYDGIMRDRLQLKSSQSRGILGDGADDASLDAEPHLQRLIERLRSAGR